jgi:uncharacterized protein YpmB
MNKKWVIILVVIIIVIIVAALSIMFGADLMNKFMEMHGGNFMDMHSGK